jgi:hypothetical protein
MKPLKWVFTHEPAILAGIIAALAVFFSVRYGTHTDAAMQGTLGGLVLTIFGTLRNFVTSPATKQALDNAPGQIAPIADDVTYLKQFVGEMITHPGGLVGMLAANGAQFMQALEDLEQRIMGVVHSNPVSPAAAVGTTTTQATVTLAEPVQILPQHPDGSPGDSPASEATTPAPEDAELAKLQGLIGS